VKNHLDIISIISFISLPLALLYLLYITGGDYFTLYLCVSSPIVLLAVFYIGFRGRIPLDKLELYAGISGRVVSLSILAFLLGPHMGIIYDYYYIEIFRWLMTYSGYGFVAPIEYMIGIFLESSFNYSITMDVVAGITLLLIVIYLLLLSLEVKIRYIAILAIYSIVGFIHSALFIAGLVYMYWDIFIVSSIFWAILNFARVYTIYNIIRIEAT
jgi:hypothetical protein